ncbi:MAG: excinuclease ABC subunit UvrC, partial [Mycoplasmataceae bacterium]|nr:excinuclease ABC subunit UvrC [Mycoplasmataceae bacterium]
GLNMNDNLKEKLNNIPKKPGVYLWKDKYNEVIYVGKAINLYNRTHQYFLFPQNLRRTQLANNIYDLDYVVTKNDNEAFILENNLIKKYQPKYNVLLKDGSNYPYILLTNEKDPRLLYTRIIKKNNGKYYGPISSGIKNKYDIYNLVLELFPLRKCNIVPKEKCLYYDLHQCVGPCINKIDINTYKAIKSNIDAFFHGEYKDIVAKLKEQELQLAQNLNFEQAQQKKELIEAIQNLTINQTVQLASLDSTDIVAYKVIDNKIGIVVFGYTNGKLLTKFDSVEDIYDDNDTEVVANYLMQYYEKFDHPKILYVSLDEQNIKLLEESLKITIKNPTKGQMKQIMLSALENADVIIKNSLRSKQNKLARTVIANEELRQLLKMESLNRIELFDNSHIDNVDRVGAMVVFENAIANKKLYRKFIIKDETSQDDLAYMKEVLYRRYSKMLKNEEALPDLIIVDGAKLQVEVANEILKELKIDLLVNVIGLKKNDEHKTKSIILKNYDEIILDKKSNLYFYLLNMQEEVHRFAISFFRQRHTKSLFSSELDHIEGLGSKRKTLLMQAFNNIYEIKNATLEQLKQVVPLNVALKLKEKFN